MYLLEIRKGVGGTKVRDPGLNPGSVEVIIEFLVVVKGHALSKALSERSKYDTGIKSKSEPSFLFLDSQMKLEGLY